MKNLDEWLARQARRDEARPRLEDALLTDRAWRYVVYRLRYLAVRTVLATGMHLAEVLLFSHLFALAYLGPVLFARSLTAVVGSAWWGGLEVLRQDVRDAAGRGHWGSAARLRDAWVGVGLWLGLAGAAAATTWVLSSPDPELGFSVFDVYVLACFGRLAVDLPVRAYTSGLSALRRAYRPLASLLVPDVLELALFVGLFPFFGAWGFGPVLLGMGVVRATLTVSYTRRAYVHTRFGRVRWRRVVAPWRVLEAPLARRFATQAAMNLSAQLDGALVAVLASTGDERVHLTVALYVLRPLVGSAFRWARLFYFDLKRLQRAYSAFFQRRFVHLLRRVALVSSAVMALVTVGAALLLWGGLAPMHLLFVPFFAVRSLLALYQVEAFVNDQRRYLLAMVGACALVLALVGMAPVSGAWTLAGLIVALTAVLGWLGPPPRAPPAGAKLGGGARLPYLEWLDRVISTSGPVRVSAATLTGSVGQIRAVADELAARLPEGAVTHATAQTLLWAEAPGAAPLLGVSDVVRIAGGRTRTLELGEVRATGREALAVLTRPVRGLATSRSLRLARVGVATLRRAFTRRFPDGVCLDLTSGRLRGDSRPPAHQLRSVVRAVASSGHPAAGVSEALEVSVYGPRGEPQLVFAMNKRYPAEARQRWRQLVWVLSAHHTVEPPATGQ